MVFDPFKPQPFNVDMAAHEAADDLPRGAPVPPVVPYQIPVSVPIEPDTDLYPRRRHGVLVQKTRR